MSKIKFILLGVVGIIALSFGAIWIFNLMLGSKPYSGPEKQKRSQTEIRLACDQHLQEAEKKATAAISKRANDIATFVQSRKSGAKPFSKDMVSVYGKWRAISQTWTFTDKNAHKKYVEERFGLHIFTNNELASQIKLAVEGGIKDFESIENELAVKLRQEVLGRSLMPDEIHAASDEFKTAIARIVAASQWDATKTAGNLVVSEVASQVGTQVLIRLGVSAGIISGGVANSWWTFGASALIGLAVDVVWELVDNPAGDIEAKTTEALNILSNQVSSAIREEMTKKLSGRCKLWEKTVGDIVP